MASWFSALVSGSSGPGSSKDTALIIQGQDTLVSLSAQVYKWVSASLMGGWGNPAMD